MTTFIQHEPLVDRLDDPKTDTTTTATTNGSALSATATAATTTTTPNAIMNTTLSPTKLPIMIHVMAPATLPGGYTFDVDLYGDPTKRFTCTVPERGVHQGEVFLAPLPCIDNDNNDDNFLLSDYSKLDIPTGRWKDEKYFWPCLNGFCHPSFIYACCCPLIGIGQVISRMQLNWLGEPYISTSSNSNNDGVNRRTPYSYNNNNRTMYTFMIIVLIYIMSTIFYLGSSLSSLFIWKLYDVTFPESTIAINKQEEFHHGNVSAVPVIFCINYLNMLSGQIGSIPWIWWIINFLGILLWTTYQTYVIYRTRRTIRERYQIKEAQCNGCEDIVCSMIPLFATSHMMRHTGDYQRCNGTYCSITGHSHGSSYIV